MGEDRKRTIPQRSDESPSPPSLSLQFVAPEFRGVDDAAERKGRIAALVCDELVPRLARLHVAAHGDEHPTLANIAELTRLILGSDGPEAADYVEGLRRSGLSVDMLFTELLEPSARRLGELWDEDAVDFIDVTLGIGRLQALLSTFNCTQEIAPSTDLRSVLMLTLPGEQHSFGVNMVERFLGAGGWLVTSAHNASLGRLATMIRDHWFGVVGLTVSNTANLPKAEDAIRTVRTHSANRDIAVMVGGPAFAGDPGLATAIGADGTAVSAITAVVLAQKLLDQSLAGTAWEGFGA
jgi:methanogenic corrinoid protein MtbC1